MPALTDLLSPAAVLFCGRADGDLGGVGERGPAGPGEAVQARRRAVLDRPWTWLRQVHGARVVAVGGDGDQAGTEADAAVSAEPNAVLAILTADCAPVALASPEGVVGAVHAGWRGLVAGVLERTVEAMRSLGASRVRASLGPCIGPECYEFSDTDLDRAAAVLGRVVRATTFSGAPALDLRAGVRASLERAGAELVHEHGDCTACSADRYFSHRARGDTGRQAMLVWRR